MAKLKILHNLPTIGKDSFGIGQISGSLARSQYLLGHDVTIWCLDNADNIGWAATTHDFPVDRIKGFKNFGSPSIGFCPQMTKFANMQELEAFDIVHQHGIWPVNSIGTLILAKKKKIHSVIAPHGSLNSWALNLSSFKKKIALALYERENLKLASCLHATSENEISDFRDFGLKNPIAYIENGILEKYLLVTGNPERFRLQYNIPSNKRILLFLSRISPKKGLEMLVEAINSTRIEFDNWQLIIAGIDEFNHKKEIESLIVHYHLESKIKIIGSLFGADKEDAFAASELFILPSYSEGAPMVVLDSLAAGVPVITTKASTWNDLVDFNCGWWTDISTPAITKALKEAIGKSSEELKIMGDSGRKLIAAKYTWPQLAGKTIMLYEWLLGRAEKPDFVLLD